MLLATFNKSMNTNTQKYNAYADILPEVHSQRPHRDQKNTRSPRG